MFELKNKFRHLATEDKSKQKIIRQLSSCLIEKFSGFTVISIENQKKQRKLFKPIDIIYKPTKILQQNRLVTFLTILQKNILLYIQKVKKV